MKHSLQYKTLVLMTLFLLALQSAFAQKFIPGYVVKTNSDTLYGFIESKEWEENPDKIKFKTNLSSVPISFMPTDITEFKTANHSFISAKVNVEVSSSQTELLQTIPKLDIEIDTIFLQTLIKGKKSLYQYRMSGGRQNFYIQQDSAIELLLYKRYVKIDNGRRVVVENKIFLGQLKLYLDDSPAIHSTIERTAYNSKDLIKLFDRYYDFATSEVDYQKKASKITTELGLLAGLTKTSVRFFKTNNPSDFENSSFEPSQNITGGVFLNVMYPKYKGKWSLRNELLFTSYNVSAHHDVYYNANRYTSTYTDLAFTHVKLNNLVRFSFPVGRTRLFVNTGISNGLKIAEKNYLIKESMFYGVESIQEGNALKQTRMREYGMLMGAGAIYKNVSFEVRNEIAFGLSNSQILSTLRTFFLLSYRFR